MLCAELCNERERGDGSGVRDVGAAMDEVEHERGHGEGGADVAYDEDGGVCGDGHQELLEGDHRFLAHVAALDQRLQEELEGVSSVEAQPVEAKCGLLAERSTVECLRRVDSVRLEHASSG